MLKRFLIGYFLAQFEIFVKAKIYYDSDFWLYFG